MKKRALPMVPANDDEDLLAGVSDYYPEDLVLNNFEMHNASVTANFRKHEQSRREVN